MRRDQTVITLKAVDRMACDANSLWHKLEELKLSIAKDAGISAKVMKRLDIFVEAEED